jgi:hypothetical protein
MATLDQARRLAERRVRDDGVVIDSPLLDRYSVHGNVAEVKSLNPARVELLSGREISVDAYVVRSLRWVTCVSCWRSPNCGWS